MRPSVGGYATYSHKDLSPALTRCRPDPPRRPGVRAMHPSHTVAEHVSESIAQVKPHLRGWLHLGILPLTLAGGILLVAMAPDGRTRAGAAVFTLSALLL